MRIFLIPAAALLLATTAAPAMLMAQDAGATSEIIVTGKYQKMWDKGSKLEAESLRSLAKAKDKLIKHSSGVVSEQNSRDTARQQSERAAADFRNLTTAMPYFADANDASSWAEKVAAAAKDWAKYDEREMESRAELSKNSKRQAAAQKDVDRAQANVDKARMMKAEAMRLSRLAAIQ